MSVKDSLFYTESITKCDLTKFEQHTRDSILHIHELMHRDELDAQAKRSKREGKR